MCRCSDSAHKIQHTQRLLPDKSCQEREDLWAFTSPGQPVTGTWNTGATCLPSYGKELSLLSFSFWIPLLEFWFHLQNCMYPRIAPTQEKWWWGTSRSVLKWRGTPWFKPLKWWKWVSFLQFNPLKWGKRRGLPSHIPTLMLSHTVQ